MCRDLHSIAALVQHAGLGIATTQPQAFRRRSDRYDPRSFVRDVSAAKTCRSAARPAASGTRLGQRHLRAQGAPEGRREEGRKLTKRARAGTRPHDVQYACTSTCTRTYTSASTHKHSSSSSSSSRGHACINVRLVEETTAP